MAVKNKKLDQNDWVPSKVIKDGFYIPCDKDDNTGELISFAKLERNKEYAEIKVKGTTRYYEIEGPLIINDKNYAKGTYIRIEEGEIFTPKSIQGCEVLCIYTKGWELKR